MTKEKMWICVYRDTIEQHNDNWNLTDILVTREFAEQYFNGCIKTDACNTYETLDDFLSEYTADDIEDFYHYAMKYNAVLDKSNW